MIAVGDLPDRAEGYAARRADDCAPEGGAAEKTRPAKIYPISAANIQEYLSILWVLLRGLLKDVPEFLLE